KAVMSNRGNALMGTGRSTGEHRATEAAQMAVSSPLLEDVSISGAEGVLVNITGGRDLTLHEVNEASSVVVAAAGEDANVIFGAVIDPNMDGEIQITVVATGFGRREGRGLSLVDGSKLARPVLDDARLDTSERPAWERRTTLRPHRAAESESQGSMEVPTFLRRTMD